MAHQVKYNLCLSEALARKRILVLNQEEITNKFIKVLVITFLATTLAGTTATSVSSVLANDVATTQTTITDENYVVKDGYRLVVVESKMFEWPADQPDPTPAQQKALLQERGKVKIAYKKLSPKLKNFELLHQVQSFVVIHRPLDRFC